MALKYNTIYLTSAKKLGPTIMGSYDLVTVPQRPIFGNPKRANVGLTGQQLEKKYIPLTALPDIITPIPFLRLIVTGLLLSI